MLKISEQPVKPPRRKRGAVSREKKPAPTVNPEKIIKKFARFRPPYLNLTLLVAVLVLSAFGLMMVYSASQYNSQIYYNTKYYFFTSQLIGFTLGLIAIAATYLVDYRVYRRWFVAFLAGGGVLLVLVFVPGIGISRLGANRWIGVGGFSMQPSEIAKFAFVIFASAVASGATIRREKKFPDNSAQTDAKNTHGSPEAAVLDDSTEEKTHDLLSFKKVLLILAAGGGFCALILLEPNLSITLCLGMTMFVLLFLYGARIKHIAAVAAPALIALPILLVAEPYRVRRLLAFIDPWARPKDEGFQLIQSLFGLGNGGFFGVGYGKSTQKHMFLPFSESDFIFSIIGEEFGFLGCIAFIAVLALIVTQIFRVGARCNDNFGKYLCFGIATLIFVQSSVNLAVVTGSIPPTGVPLPFISFGGTSLAVYMAAIGVVLNVDKRNKLSGKFPRQNS